MLMFYSVQTTNSTVVGRKMRCTVDSHSIAYFQILSIPNIIFGVLYHVMWVKNDTQWNVIALHNSK